MDQRTINILSLCSGGAGLDLGVELALGDTRTVCWVEWEAFAIEYLASCMEAECLPQAPIWSDLRTFNGKPWRGVVDCITTGYPCQPFSVAGKRRGKDDPRHLWPHVHRVIGEVEPAIVFLENVSGHLSLGFDQVASDLEGLGYEVAAGLFTAEEVGATHNRERLFILALADANGQRCEGAKQPQVKTLAEIEQQSPFPPGPADDWRNIPREYWPASSESDLRFVAYGLAKDRTRFIKLLGNGVVPLQAAYAFVSLFSALRGGE